MNEKITLKLNDREITGKKVRQLRSLGLVPAVVYGAGMRPKNVSIDEPEAIKIWRIAGKHHVLEVSFDGKKRLAMIKTVDIEPVKHKLRHLAMQVVKQNEKIETQVPIKVSDEGETPAEKSGLVVLKTIETVVIQAIPKNLPDYVEIPGEKLIAEGDTLKVADILPIDGVEITSDPDQVVVTVYEPSALVAANEAAGGESESEPEEPEESAPGSAEEPKDSQQPEDKNN